MVAAVIHTDGAYSRDRDVGGWAALIDIPGDQANITYGRVRHTTNNRMEMVAIIKGLQAVKNKDAAVVFTDSELIVKQFNGEYEINANLDLWEDLARHRDRLANVVLKWLPRNSTMQLEEADKLSKLMTDEKCQSPEFTTYGAIPPQKATHIPDAELSAIVAAAVAEAEGRGEPEEDADGDTDGEVVAGGSAVGEADSDGDVGGVRDEPSTDRPVVDGEHSTDLDVPGDTIGDPDDEDDDDPSDPSNVPVANPQPKARPKTRRSKTKIASKKA